MAYTRQQMIALAKQYLGATKGSARHKDLVNTFNKVKPHGEVGNYTCAWCAITVTAWAIKAGYFPSNWPMSYNCGTLISDAKKLGVWIENDAYVPKIGDLILYDWQDSGKGDNTNSPDHVGMVIAVSSNSFTVIEGNMTTASKVGTRVMNINGRYIRGFISPKYVADGSNKTSYKPTTPYTGKLPTSDVAYGDKSTDVTYTQQFLNWGINAKLKVDGDCGPATTQAITVFEDTYNVSNPNAVFGPGCRKAAKALIAAHKNDGAASNTSATTIKTSIEKGPFKVIDVSVHQGTINWTKVKAAGIVGAIIRYADYNYSGHYIDPNFDTNVKGALAAGLHVGTYIYSGAKSASDAEKEAIDLYNVSTKYKIDMPMYIDLEVASHSKVADTVAKAFINKMVALGGRPGVYANLTWWNNYLTNTAKNFETYSFWIAQYNTKITHSTPSLFGMWQYSSSGKVNGISGNVDMNWCYTPYWNTISTTAPTEVETKKGYTGEYPNITVKETISKQQLIAKTANELAYPDNTTKAKYPSGKPVEAFTKAFDKVFPTHNKWGAVTRTGASCDVWVGTVVKAAGVDKNFPRGLAEQIKYLPKCSTFKLVSTDPSKAQTGDIITYNHKTKTGGHICIRYGSNLKHASYKAWFGRTTGVGKRFNKDVNKNFKVWRAVGSSTTTRNYLKYSDKGAEVVKLQNYLNYYFKNTVGWMPLDLDGNFGTLTKKAVEKFQSENKLTADGLVGANTLQHMHIK